MSILSPCPTSQEVPTLTFWRASTSLLTTHMLPFPQVISCTKWHLEKTLGRKDDALLTFTLPVALSSVPGVQPIKLMAHGLTLQSRHFMVLIPNSSQDQLTSPGSEHYGMGRLHQTQTACKTHL